MSGADGRALVLMFNGERIVGIEILPASQILAPGAVDGVPTPQPHEV